MHWWAWLTLWTVLVGGGLYVHFVLIRRVWRSMKAFGNELSEAVERLDTVSERLTDLQQAIPEPDRTHPA